MPVSMTAVGQNPSNSIKLYDPLFRNLEIKTDLPGLKEVVARCGILNTWDPSVFLKLLTEGVLEVRLFYFFTSLF